MEIDSEEHFYITGSTLLLFVPRVTNLYHNYAIFCSCLFYAGSWVTGGLEPVPETTGTRQGMNNVVKNFKTLTNHPMAFPSSQCGFFDRARPPKDDVSDREQLTSGKSEAWQVTRAQGAGHTENSRLKKTTFFQFLTPEKLSSPWNRYLWGGLLTLNVPRSPGNARAGLCWVAACAVTTAGGLPDRRGHCGFGRRYAVRLLPFSTVRITSSSVTLQWNGTAPSLQSAL